jgi:hypothetical protein
MDAQDILKKYGLDPPLAHGEFLRQLRKLPTYDRNWLYSPAPPQGLLVQGDVVGPVNYTLTSEDNEIGVLEGDVMLISNSCDMVPNQSPFALIAPVTEMTIYTKPEASEDDEWSNHLTALRKFEIDSYYYLPSWFGRTDSFADFSRITHLPSAYLQASFVGRALQRSASLSSKGHLLLLSKLAYFLLRLETKEVERQTEA